MILIYWLWILQSCSMYCYKYFYEFIRINPIIFSYRYFLLLPLLSRYYLTNVNRSAESGYSCFILILGENIQSLFFLTIKYGYFSSGLSTFSLCPFLHLSEKFSLKSRVVQDMYLAWNGEPGHREECLRVHSSNGLKKASLGVQSCVWMSPRQQK